VPALVRAVLAGAAHEEGVILSDVVQATGVAVVVAAGSAAGLLGLSLVVIAVAPGRDGDSLGTLGDDDDSENGNEEEGGELVEGHLQ